jgi:hypothetical protein
MFDMATDKTEPEGFQPTTAIGADGAEKEDS